MGTRSSARRSVTFISEDVRGENGGGTDKGVGSVGMSPRAEAPLRVFNETLQVSMCGLVLFSVPSIYEHVLHFCATTGESGSIR